MKSLRARIGIVASPERRESTRWHVELLVSLDATHGADGALVRNLSEDGMLLETSANLRIGESILVDLPGAEQTEARIMWQQDTSFGCAFLERIPTAAVSATLLRAPLNEPPEGSDEPQFEEFPIAVRPNVDQLEKWKNSFERSKGTEGYRIVAYRQTSDGLMIAIASKMATA